MERTQTEPRPSWTILSRVARHVGHELSLPLAKRPRLSNLTIPSRFGEYPTYYGDAEHPYIVAANDAGLLLHVSPKPYVGFNLDPNPEGNLVVAWDFYLVDGTGRDELCATTVRVADRAVELSHCSGIKSVGLLPLSSPAGFVVAELQVVEDHGRRAANLILFLSDEDSWNEVELTCPDVTPGASAEWMPHDVIAYDRKLWWVDLTRGFLVCNPVDPKPHLSFVSLPDLTGEMFVALDDRHEGLERIDSRRIVRVSGGKLRFVDVVRRCGEPPEATRVIVWTLDLMFDPSTGRARWEHHQCMTTLAAIWDHASYVESGMPREFPVLAFLHPDKHAVVYFFLDEYLFSVNVYDSAVVQFAGEARGDVVEVIDGPQPINWRYVLAWVPNFKMVRY
ncbi:hypothetical protein GQ55_1G259000 [Panicum hallii var. hallii]|uniref:DUF1618 domain-containing protein n=1 Tax=Panicum hallii var. hallii TaxID=1504633 RepID=A0A2T7F7H6_9POAL|nr:hypothetical protein GQ55_1G259000 [Panicum hallii var. hallii]